MRHKFLTSMILLAGLCVGPQRIIATGLNVNPVLLRFDDTEILTGRFSVFARFQEKLSAFLRVCDERAPSGSRPQSEAETAGHFGPATGRNIDRAVQCGLSVQNADSERLSSGVVTGQLWRAVMGDEPTPTVVDRAQAMILSFEATDFGEAPEWNLCADGYARPPSTPPGTPDTCYNATDKCSLITWGPRGATAGAGREIQNVLWMVWMRDPKLIEQAFGKDAAALRRFFRLRGSADEKCDADFPLKHFVCAIWIDPRRRSIWENALRDLGKEPLVRQSYEKLYASAGYDGGTLRDYYKLWYFLHLKPTEIDYAFFLDRTTHIGAPPSVGSALANQLAACVAGQIAALSRNGAARHCLAILHTHETQAEARLARDVSYYLDAYPDSALPQAEVHTWSGYVALTAERNFGLSDRIEFPQPAAADLDRIETDLPVGDLDNLNPTEINGCPRTILFPSMPVH